MCVVSMVGDYYRDRWTPRPWYPQTPPPQPYQPLTAPQFPQTDWSKVFPGIQGISRKEFEDLKKEVFEMKELLKRAAKYDEENGEPACEMEDKVALLKKVAEAVGVSLEDVFPSNA